MWNFCWKIEHAVIAMLDANDYWLDNHLKDCLSILKRKGCLTTTNLHC